MFTNGVLGDKTVSEEFSFEAFPSIVSRPITVMLTLLSLF